MITSRLSQSLRQWKVAKLKLLCAGACSRRVFHDWSISFHSSACAFAFASLLVFMSVMKSSI